MFKSIRYRNFKALRDATLQLGAFNLLVGPNGSGKNTALQALQLASKRSGYEYSRIQSLGATSAPVLELAFKDLKPAHVTFGQGGYELERFDTQIEVFLRRARFFILDPAMLSAPARLQPGIELGPRGENLVVVLDQLRDQSPERFDQLNRDLSQWLPEFDRVLFETPGDGNREFQLRVAGSAKGIKASELSHGTLFALALLTLANLDQLPSFIAIEEPDRGVHPRMLRRVQDALYRLAFPEHYKDARAPVQVVVTTHSPFVLDLYRDHPEQIIVAERKESGAEFTRLQDRADLKTLLGDASLGDLWYSGILGGVPSET